MKQKTQQKQQNEKVQIEEGGVFDEKDSQQDRGLEPSEGVLELKGHKRFAQLVRETNAQFPWLKIVLVVVLVGLMVLGVGEVLRYSVSHPEDVAVEAPQPEEPIVPAEPTPEVVEKPEEKSEDTEVEEKPTEPEKQVTTTATASSKSPAVVSTGKKLIALTFDDGPSAKTTPRLLQILAEKGVKATFFVIGSQAAANPGLLKQEAQEGHEVGSHTMTHANLVKLGAGDIAWQCDQMNAIFQQHLGRNVEIMRPPYGSVNATVRQTVPQPMILWTIDPEDWKYRNAASVRSKVVGAAFDGAIVLMHDIHSTTVDAVPGIIDDLRAQGYEFLTVSELAATRGVALQRGTAYGSFRP